MIEVLVSIVLFTIILTSVLAFFTQSAQFSGKNEQKLDIIQMAQKISNLVELEITKEDLQNTSIINSNGIVLNSPKKLGKLELETYLDESLDTNYNIQSEITNHSSESLIMFKIIVQDPHDLSNQTETYTYIRR